MSLLSSDCYFESLALQETFAGPQVCALLVLPPMHDLNAQPGAACALLQSAPAVQSP